MKQWLGWMTIGLLAMGLGACGKEVKPTATVNTSTPTSGRHFPAMTATPGLPAPTLTPTLTPVPPAYPVGSTATPLPYPLPTLAGGYPGSQYSPPTPTPTAVVEWFVPVTQVTVFPPDGGPSLNVQCENGKWVLFSDWDNNNKVSEFVPPASAGCPAWVEWSPDYESAALVSSSKEVYLWATDGALPQFVGNTFGAS